MVMLWGKLPLHPLFTIIQDFLRGIVDLLHRNFKKEG